MKLLPRDNICVAPCVPRLSVISNTCTYGVNLCPRPRHQYHVIGFEAIVQNTTSKYVHHLVLTACTGTDDCGQACAKLSRSSGYYSSSSSSLSLSNTSLSNTSSTSTRSISSAASDVSTEYEYQTSAFCDFEFTYIFIWAPGVADEQLPKDVGFKFGSASGGYTSLQLETHYNNVDGDEGVMDSSGIRVYYTSDLRPIDMGVLSLGDPSVWLGGFPIPEGKSSILFECPGSCTADNFEVRPYARVRLSTFFCWHSNTLVCTFSRVYLCCSLLTPGELNCRSVPPCKKIQLHTCQGITARERVVQRFVVLDMPQP